MNKESLNIESFKSPFLFFLYLSSAIFITELGVMLSLQHLASLPLALENFIDAFLLTLITCPVVYFFSFKPLATQNADLIKAREKINLQSVSLNAAANSIAITDVNGIIEWVNPAFTKLNGYEPHEVVGKNMSLIKSGRYDQAFYKSFWDTILSGEVWQGEIINKKKDGSLFAQQQTVTPVKNSQGKIEHFVTILLDITELKQAEEVIKQRNKELEDSKKAMMNVVEDLEDEKKRSETFSHDLEKFKLAVDNVSDNIIITDREGIVLYTNSAIEKVTGYKPEEAVGKKSGTLWKSPMPSEFYQKMWDTISNQKKVFTGEIQNKRKNGQIYTAAISISPIINEKGNIEFFVGVERDITKEKEIDRVKSEFVSIASHQLRTPTGIIKWYIEALKEDEYYKKAPATAKEYIDIVYKNNERTLSLVRDLLSVSRIDQGRTKDSPEKTDIAELVKSIVGEMKIMALKDNLDLTCSIHDESIPLIYIDPARLREVIENLVSNAIKFSSKNGKIEVGTGVKDGMIEISVKDMGIGISSEDQKNLFTKFFRAEKAVLNNTEGTGLGLYMVKAYVDGWGGSVSVLSEEGKGSTFTIKLPMVPKGEVN